MTTLRFHYILLALLTLMASIVCHAAGTSFSVHLKRNIPGGGLQQRLLPAVFEKNLVKNGYVIDLGMMNTDESQYSLHVSPVQDGVRVALKMSLQKESPAIQFEDHKIINGVILSHKDSEPKYQYQLLNSQLEPLDEAVEIPTLSQHTSPVRHSRTKTKVAAMPDLIAVLNLLVRTHKDQDESSLGEEATSLAQALDGVVYPDECTPQQLLTFVEADDDHSGILDKGNRYAVPVHDMKSPLEDTTHFEPIIPRASSKNPFPSVITTVYNRSDMPKLGYMTSPIFIEGSGQRLIPRKGATVRGDLYFLQVTDDSHDGMLIELYPLHKPTVEQSADVLPNNNAELTLHISADNKTVHLYDASSEHLAKVHLDSPLAMLAACSTLERKVKSINYVKLANMMSEWTDWLQQPDEPSHPLPPELDEKIITACFNGQRTPVAQLHSRISFSHLPDTLDVNMGYKNSHLHLPNTLMNPFNPAHGLATDALYLLDGDGEKTPYSIHLISHASNSYVATLHSLPSRLSEKYQASIQTERLMNGASDALATLQVEYIENNKIRVQMFNQDGTLHHLSTLDTTWNMDKDIISLLPLQLTHREAKNKTVNLPGLSVCTNLLAHATTGVFIGDIDESQLTALTHPQASLDTSDSSGAYYSDVQRDSAVPHFRHITSRQFVGATKRSLRLMAKHPRKAIFGGVSLGVAVATGAYFFPDVATTTYSGLIWAAGGFGLLNPGGGEDSRSPTLNPPGSLSNVSTSLSGVSSNSSSSNVSTDPSE
uniref:hypothetical protein n=1 Tax=Parendozoicomonas sp. Alg238-R29 TaxID=2993446 RepID=UPI00248EBF19